MSELRRIVIVEDEPMTANLYAMVLENAGYHASIAQSSKEVFDLLSRSTCALVLLDLYLPERGDWEGGWEILRRIRERFSAEELPVLVLSAEAEAAVRSGIVELGANEYLTKPVSPTALLEAAQRWVRTEVAKPLGGRREA